MIEYEAMMYSILKKYGLYNKREDYIDICYIGYCKALKKYDNSKSKPQTYIYKCIENELLVQLRKENTQKRKNNDLSLEYSYEDNQNMHDCIKSDENIEQHIITKEDGKELLNIISKLNKEEKYIITSLFGIGCIQKTQIELSNEFNTSQANISKIKDKITEKMRGMI